MNAHETMVPETVLITGAAKRIGRELALDMASLGWRVAVHYNASRDAALAVVDEIAAAGGLEAVVGRADASLFELVERAALPQLDVALQPGARERTGARQNISNLAWAFAAADVGGDTLFGGASPFVPRVVASLALDDESARESSRPSMKPERSVSNRLKATAHRSTVVRVAAVCCS